jgi:hypothetical protein
MNSISSKFCMDGPSKDFHATTSSEEAIWNPPDTGSESSSGEDEEDGYTSSENNENYPRRHLKHQRSTITRKRKPTSKLRDNLLSSTSNHMGAHNPVALGARDTSSSLRTPASPPSASSDLGPQLDPTTLQPVWNLLESWYLKQGKHVLPPCAVHQRRLDQLYFVGTPENKCRYIHNDGREFDVTSRPLRGWEDCGFYIFIALYNNQNPVIIKKRGNVQKEKGNEDGRSSVPFYIWKGIDGDENGWENQPSISKTVSHKNSSIHQAVIMKRSHEELPDNTTSSSLDANPGKRKYIRRLQPLLSEAFPNVYGQLTGWMKLRPEKTKLPFLLDGQPELYSSKSRPDLQISYVDIDGKPVQAGLYSMGTGNKHVIVAHGPTLDPAVISFDHLKLLPKYYTAYYQWTSPTTWFKTPKVFKVFGVGPYEPPRKFVTDAEAVGSATNEGAGQ